MDHSRGAPLDPGRRRRVPGVCHAARRRAGRAEPRAARCAASRGSTNGSSRPTGSASRSPSTTRRSTSVPTKAWVVSGAVKHPPMFGIGAGIEQNTHRIGECVDARELQHAIAMLARFPRSFVDLATDRATSVTCVSSSPSAGTRSSSAVSDPMPSGSGSTWCVPSSPWPRSPREHELVVTHGNGPQVGVLAMESAADTTLTRPYPLDPLGAETQGLIGYWLSQALGNVLPGRRVAAMLTQCVVDAGDPAFATPTKFVGPTYDEATAAPAGRRAGMGGRARRCARGVGSSPRPSRCRVVEADVIRLLVDAGVVVVCAGGGGVPVVATSTGALQGRGGRHRQGPHLGLPRRSPRRRRAAAAHGCVRASRPTSVSRARR